MKRTPRWKGDTEQVIAYTEKELQEGWLQNLIRSAAQLWKLDFEGNGGDRGTCVIGAGIAIWVRGHRKRYAKSRVIVAPPGQADCGWCKDRAMVLLEEQLEGVHFEYGRMD
jgi:hypothetical protein